MMMMKATLVAGAAGLAATFFAVGASAQCVPECPQGMLCEQQQQGCPAIYIECPEGEVCEQPACEPEDLNACVPGPCTSNADCGADLVCVEYVSESCPDVAECPPDTFCEPVEPGECVTETESLCTPKWLAPCETAADCGTGFDCVAEESCMCSGSSGAPADPDDPDGGVADPVPEPECSCEPTGQMICQAQEIDCTADAAVCPENWTCETNPHGVCTASTDGTVVCTTEGPEMLCMPPYGDTLAMSGGVYAGEAGSATSGTDQGGEEATPSESSDSGGGCSVSGAGSTSSAWLLALAALVPFVRRRRQ